VGGFGSASTPEPSAAERGVANFKWIAQDHPLFVEGRIRSACLPKLAGDLGVSPLEEESSPLLGVEAGGEVQSGRIALAKGFIEQQGSGYRNVEGSSHSHHRDSHGDIDEGEGFGGDPKALRAHQEGRRACVVDLPEVDGASARVRSHDLKSGHLEEPDCRRPIGMLVHSHPLCRPGGGVPMELEASLWVDSMHVQHTDGVTVPQNGGEIMGLVDPLHHHRQIGLAAIQYAAESLESFREHGLVGR